MHAFVLNLPLFAEAYIARCRNEGPVRLLYTITSISWLNYVLVSMSSLASFRAISGPAPSYLSMDMAKNAACSPLWTLPAAC